MLMLGNLLRESLVVERLSKSAQNEIANVSTLFLGVTIGATMNASSFLNLDTLLILAMGLLAFVLDTVAGLLFGKAMSAVTRRDKSAARCGRNQRLPHGRTPGSKNGAG